VKRAAVVAACLLVGLAAGAIWSTAQSNTYRSDGRVLVRPASARIVPAVEALAESSLVATNVAQTLHLSSPPNISAEKGDSGVLTVSASAGSRERARQIDAEALVILMQKVSQRFRAARVTATVLDPAHVAEQTSPSMGRNFLIAGLAGLIVGIAAAAALSRPRAAPTGAVAGEPRVERRLKARIDQVARRERQLAQRAGHLAAREHDLQRREQELDRRPVPDAEPPSAPEAPPEPAPAAEVPPEPVPTPAATQQRAGGWTLPALEALTRERSDSAPPEQREEWSTYLFFLREHAAAGGALPSSFDQLVNEVFGPLPPRDE
jgi:hypothetical protein